MDKLKDITIRNDFNIMLKNKFDILRNLEPENNMQQEQRWLGHVLRWDSNSIIKTALFWTPEGKRKREGESGAHSKS